jgi:hypothetical protein
MHGIVNRFADNVIEGQVTCKHGIFTVAGLIHWGFRDNVVVTFRAAEPPDLRLSVKGSALPFANPEQAYGPINSGVVKLDDKGHFHFNLISPNSYYKNDDIMNRVGQGKILVEPMVSIVVHLANKTKKKYEVDLSGGIPLRSLTNYPGKPVRSEGRNTPSYIY